MTIAQIYTRYQIMPSLQLHMYRVAGVAKLVCDHWSPALDSSSVITATLLHDMGNIIKFDLERFPDFVQPEGLSHWASVQKEYVERYGPDEHFATLAIARELGVSERIVQLIEAVGFAQTQSNLTNRDYEAMIAHYADLRVTPLSVVSLDERLQDLENRYGAKYSTPAHQAQRQEFSEFARQMEKILFSYCTITPGEITEAQVSVLRPQLEAWTIG